MARLHLDLSETHDELVETLMRMGDLRTKKDVIENALILLGWAMKEVQHGRVIAAIDEAAKTYKEIQTSALLGAQRKRTQSDATPSERHLDEWNRRIQDIWEHPKAHLTDDDLDKIASRLTDDDLDKIAGRRVQLEGMIQERHGVSKDKVRKDVDVGLKKQ